MVFFFVYIIRYIISFNIIRKNSLIQREKEKPSESIEPKRAIFMVKRFKNRLLWMGGDQKDYIGKLANMNWTQKKPLYVQYIMSFMCKMLYGTGRCCVLHCVLTLEIVVYSVYESIIHI